MKVGRVFGITVRVNVFFIILFFLLFLAGKQFEGFIAFGVVLIHEMAHVITALNYKFQVSEVELLPFGGVARMVQGFEGDPYAEVFVAVAGPLINFLMAMGAYFLGDMGNQQWVPFFIECNLMLGFFNLLPAYPLDGGRIYRAFLVGSCGVKNASDKALRLSLYISVLLVLIGMIMLAFKFNGINLLVVGGFLIYNNLREKGNTMFIFLKYLNQKKQDLNLKRLMLARHVVALEDVELKELVRYFVPQKYNIVVRINKDQQITGVFTESEIINRLMEEGINLTLSEM